MYSLYTLLNAYNENKEFIEDYIKNREKYDNGEKEGKHILNLTVSIFLLVFLITIILWIVGLVMLILQGKEMPTWAIVLAVIFLISFPLFTILLAALARK
jgi:ABC-type transport system involved in cytochrome bd biosynthesis fused ATPase/permease subunit